MAGARLIAHCGGKYMTRGQIAGLDNGGMPPMPLGPHHKPVPHIELIESLTDICAERGLTVKREQFATMRDGGTFLFGTFDFNPIGGDFADMDEDGRGLSLGFRSGNAFEKPIEIAIGQHVFVCDNLAFAGGVIVLKRRHTLNLDLIGELKGAVDKYLVESRAMEVNVGRFKDYALEDTRAKELLFDMATGRGGVRQVFPVTRLPDIAAAYLDAPSVEDEAMRTPDCEPRSLWGLHNAVTRVARAMKPQPRFETTVKLGAFAEQLVGVRQVN